MLDIINARSEAVRNNSCLVVQGMFFEVVVFQVGEAVLEGPVR